MDSITLHLRRGLPAIMLALLSGLAFSPDTAEAQWRVGGTGYGSSVRTSYTPGSRPGR